jgi:hypothetical protein
VGALIYKTGIQANRTDLYQPHYNNDKTDKEISYKKIRNHRRNRPSAPRRRSRIIYYMAHKEQSADRI